MGEQRIGGVKYEGVEFVRCSLILKKKINILKMFLKYEHLLKHKKYSTH